MEAPVRLPPPVGRAGGAAGHIGPRGPDGSLHLRPPVPGLAGPALEGGRLLGRCGGRQVDAALPGEGGGDDQSACPLSSSSSFIVLAPRPQVGPPPQVPDLPLREGEVELDGRGRIGTPERAGAAPGQLHLGGSRRGFPQDADLLALAAEGVAVRRRGRELDPDRPVCQGQDAGPGLPGDGVPDSPPRQEEAGGAGVVVGGPGPPPSALGGRTRCL